MSIRTKSKENSVARSLLTAAACVCLIGFSGPPASAQAATCPQARVGAPLPVELGVEAAERDDFALAARYFEQHKACIEHNRPRVRDSINGDAANRLVHAYLAVQDASNILRVTSEALSWHPAYVSTLPIGADRSEQFHMLIFFHGARAWSLQSLRRSAEAEVALDQARSLLARYPSEQPESALMVLAMSATLVENDYEQYAPIQRDLVQRLRQFGPDYRSELRQELLNLARVSRGHGNVGAAIRAEAEARALP